MAIANYNEEKNRFSFIHLRNFITASKGSPPNNVVTGGGGVYTYNLTISHKMPTEIG